ncbi:MAG: bifunctional riboflavin kinase/FAD synthetase [Bacteroidales bacterium]|jgi:riboflavin kinase/FMN adenylyltransferase
MRVFHDIKALSLVKPVTTLGIFDGVHRAHREVIDRCRSIADKISGETVIVTLWPHPRKILQDGKNSFKLLTDLEEKINLLDLAGIDNLVVLTFDRQFASTGFDEFVKDVLVDGLNIEHLVVGYNHQFGKNREGNYEKLALLAEKYRFGLTQLEPFLIGDERVSSTKIRNLIHEGDLRRANEFLGYNFFLSGRVTGGNRKGRTIGFPTANILVDDPYKIIPGDGVYAVFAVVEGKRYEGMMNIGCRPTIDEDCDRPVPEVNLFDYSGDLYDKEIHVSFIQRIREEQKFKTLDELAAQIKKDKILIKDILSSVKKTEI